MLRGVAGAVGRGWFCGAWLVLCGVAGAIGCGWCCGAWLVLWGMGGAVGRGWCCVGVAGAVWRGWCCGAQKSSENSKNPASNFSADRRAWYGFVAGLAKRPSRLVRVCTVAPDTGLRSLLRNVKVLLQSMGAVAAALVRAPSRLVRVCVAKPLAPGHPFLQKRTSIFGFPGAAGELAATDLSQVSVVGRRARSRCPRRILIFTSVLF